MMNIVEHVLYKEQMKEKAIALASWLCAKYPDITVWSDGTLTYEFFDDIDYVTYKGEYRVSKKMLKRGKWLGKQGSWNIFLTSEG